MYLFCDYRTYSITTISNFRGSAKDLVNQLLSSITPQVGRNVGMSMDVDMHIEPVYLDSSSSFEADSMDDIHMKDSDPMDDILPLLEELIVACFTPSFHNLFLKHYGVNWKAIVSNEPWTIHDICNLFKTEWESIFELICSEYASCKNGLGRLARLSKDIARVNDMGISSITMGDIHRFILDIEPFLVICDAAGFPNDKVTATHHLNLLMEKM
jgi:hypothetical protein